MLKFYCSSINNPEAPFVENSEVLLSISIIAEQHNAANGFNFQPENQSGPGFLEMVNTIINNSKITKLILLDTAYLQRHRKLIELASSDDIDESRAERIAEKLVLEDSVLWKIQEHNAQGINLLREKYKENFSILNWVDILLHPEYKSMLSKINYLYFSDATVEGRKFRYAVNRLIDIFFRKLTHKIKESIKQGKLSIQFARNCLRNIVLEESAVRALLKYPYEIYRGPPNIPTTMAYKKFGEEGKMIAVSIGSNDEVDYYKKVNNKVVSEQKFEKRISKFMPNNNSDLIDVQILKFKVTKEEFPNFLKHFKVQDNEQLKEVRTETINKDFETIIKKALFPTGKKVLHILSLYDCEE